ncbi:hypothetical protein [Acidovorax sp. SUPP2825]|uniref:hypothetical protein n=1 Tax=Acidovorax sp. SUPP2825 TaxID=2920879 RepID=UPI0023DE32DF|nr:hypothetical protein [Acidovorax sp. SUPP2825]GKS96938.1 hypothetical protein AVAK2825_20405 [Acidovorax sp. SUPP2825]
MNQNHYDNEALRLAAVSPRGDDDDAPMQESDEQRDLDDLCERWVCWKATRRLYGPAPTMGSVLGQLSGTRTRPLQPGGPDAVSSAELAALHVAYTCQPDALDKRVFDLYYVHRIAPVKRAAAALAISRKHFYTVLGDFRKRLHIASLAIMEDEASKLAVMEDAREKRRDVER